ncbi:hypothetical protein MKZ38_008657 [Zalerion maritima]|uniref:Uncharacterized protein n=1 Tax=Zalerion maritima TaxID=339359 RepID=A0AAD5RHF8_9PEZI|nr:hypothetical protein MKZ38_008657 [Zalerion maritima]
MSPAIPVRASEMLLPLRKPGFLAICARHPAHNKDPLDEDPHGDSAHPRTKHNSIKPTIVFNPIHILKKRVQEATAKAETAGTSKVLIPEMGYSCRSIAMSPDNVSAPPRKLKRSAHGTSRVLWTSTMNANAGNDRVKYAKVADLNRTHKLSIKGISGAMSILLAISVTSP